MTGNHRLIFCIGYRGPMSLRVLFITAMLALPPTGSADEPGWVAIGPGDSFTEYVDVNSLRIRAGRLTASILIDFAAPHKAMKRAPSHTDP